MNSKRLKQLWELWTRLQAVKRNAIPKSRDVGIATTVALVATGWLDARKPFAPLNAVSHIAWGEDAIAQDEFSLKYTGVGALLSTFSTGGWAALHEFLCAKSQARGDVLTTLLGGVAVSGFAWFVDYKIVPRRLQPGFESRVSRASMWMIYAVLAASLAVSGVLRARSREIV